MPEVRLLSVCDCDTCQAPERENICDGITAQAVRTMNTAGHFADSMESGNNLTVSVNDLSVGIDHNTAHGVVNRHAGVTSPERSFLNLSQVVRFLTASIVTSFTALVVLFNGLNKVCRINTGLLS